MNNLPDDISHGNSRSRFELPDKILVFRRPTLVKYAGHLRARGKDFEQIHDALLTANDERCCPPIADEKGLKGIERLAKWASSKPAGVSEEGTISDADRQTIEKALAFIASFPWRGVASNNAKVAAVAVLHKMHELGRLTEIGFSCRDLAEEVGLSFAAASAALRRLCGIRKDKRDDIPLLFSRTIHKKRVVDSEHLTVKALAYEYSLNLPAISAHTASPAANTVSCVAFAGLLLIVSHDAFRMRGKGLTRSAAHVLTALPARTQAELVKRTHLSERTVRTALKALTSEGLIEKNEKTSLWTRTSETLEVVAERRGTAGEGIKQWRLHTLQRENYSAWLMQPRTKKSGKVFWLHNIEEASVPRPNWEGNWEAEEFQEAA